MAKNNQKQWNDQELHQLFAERLPLLQMPDDFLERLTESVLDEVNRHVEHRIMHRLPSDSAYDLQPPTGSEKTPTPTTGHPTHCKTPKRSLPPL